MAKSFAVKKQETVFGLEDTLTFGKCKGATLEVVLQEDSRYIRWCLDNIPWFKLDKDAETMLLVWEARDDEHDRTAGWQNHYPSYRGAAGDLGMFDWGDDNNNWF
jgi:hypothetical protein